MYSKSYMQKHLEFIFNIFLPIKTLFEVKAVIVAREF